MRTQTDILDSNLKILAATFAGATGFRPSTIGRYVHGSDRFFAGIDRRPGNYSVETYDRMVAEFARRWPDKAPWPAGIDRPEVSERGVRGHPGRRQAQPSQTDPQQTQEA